MHFQLLWESGSHRSDVRFEVDGRRQDDSLCEHVHMISAKARSEIAIEKAPISILISE